MASEWAKVGLEEIAELTGGFAFKSEDYSKSGRFVLRTLNIGEDGAITKAHSVYLPESLCSQYERFELQDKDTLFVMVGATLGKIGRVQSKDLPALLNQNMWRIRARPGLVDPDFLHYSFSFAAIEQLSWASGSARSFVRREDYRKLVIQLPPLKMQRSIGQILHGIEERASLQRTASDTMEKIARALFKSWFVDFDPVRAKAEGREPEGMDTATAALFPSEFIATAVGDRPRGWSVSRLADFMDINPLRSLSKTNPAPYLEMANAPTSGPSALTWSARLPMPGCRFRNGDTLLAKITPCLENGKTVLVDFLQEDEVGWGSTEFIVLRPRNNVPPAFGYLLARDKDFRAFAIQSMSGTSGRQRVQIDQLAKFEFTIADTSVYRAFREIVEPLFRAITHNNDAAKILTSLRDTLLSRLISGKLRVPEAEKVVEGVL